MNKYRSKPQEVEAVQWTGDNHDEVLRFVTDEEQAATYAKLDESGALLLLAGKDGAQGYVGVPVGHWIVRSPGDLSDHWPVDPDYFAAKYEPVG